MESAPAAPSAAPQAPAVAVAFTPRPLPEIAQEPGYPNEQRDARRSVSPVVVGTQLAVIALMVVAIWIILKQMGWLPAVLGGTTTGSRTVGRRPSVGELLQQQRSILLKRAP